MKFESMLRREILMAGAAALLFAAGCGGSEADGAEGEPLDCEVAIVGGGPGGLHTAFRLAPTLKAGVCLFEREATLGGRIHDVPFDEQDPEGPRVGVGARRVMEGQEVLFALAEELGLELQTPGPAIDLINARGTFAFTKDELVPLYPGMPLDQDPDLDQETWLYDQLRFGPERANADKYPDFRSYAQAVIGSEGHAFLRDMSRFRADFDYPLDARGYLDYLDEEWDVCCTPSYPVGGMSRFIVGMQAAAEKAGARVFTEEPVTEIRRAEGGGYALTTAKYAVTARKVVIAAPPVAVDLMSGDLVEEIRAQPAYQDIIAVPVVTITQWWPTAWWADIVNPNLDADNHVWRAWTTEHCLNFIEIPNDDYAAAQKVTRSVYDDELDCTNFWEEVARDGTEAVEEEVRRGLLHLFNENGITEPAKVTIPKPVKTHVQVWPAAWHWLSAGASVTNAELFEWATQPLKGEDVALVGEAYNVQRSGWSDGAYKSSINLLNKRYGMKLPGL